MQRLLETRMHLQELDYMNCIRSKFVRGKSFEFIGESVFSNSHERRPHDRGFIVATLESPKGTVFFGDGR